MKETLCHTPELPFEAGACTKLGHLCASHEELEAVKRILDHAYYFGGHSDADDRHIVRFRKRIAQTLDR